MPFNLKQIYDADGVFAKAHEGYEYRPHQYDLSKQVAEALATNNGAIFEAETGMGKTYAYLVPLLLGETKALISTSTKNLQDQLMKRDIPFLCKQLKISADIQVLKGRSNYICLRRLSKAKENIEEGIFPSDKKIDTEITKIHNYVERTQNGDIAEIGGVRQHSRVWPLVTSTRENCIGSKCSDFNECFVYQAYKRAAKAQITIVNHSLLLIEAARYDGDNSKSFLPGFEACIIDEAHQIVDDLPRYFANELSMYHFRRKLENITKQKEIISNPELLAAINDCLDITNLVNDIALEVDASILLAKELLVKKEFLKSLEIFSNKLQSTQKLFIEQGDDELMQEIAKELDSATDVVIKWIARDETNFGWLERGKENAIFLVAPYNTATLFNEKVATRRKTILMSSTLSIDKSFSYVVSKLGMNQAKTGHWPSSFDYQKNSMLLLLEGLPNPSEKNYISEIVKIAADLIEANNGRAFLLFATHANLQEAQVKIRKLLDKDFELLIQGQDESHKLLSDFKKSKGVGKVLLGTRTFWQGVDVPGNTLSLVLIDKIPFIPPDDPLLEIETMNLNAQDNPFTRLQLPKAIMHLKQAAGRLIRSSEDRGVLVLCDPRVTSKHYGQKIIKSLPNMKQTKDINEARSFLEEINC